MSRIALPVLLGALVLAAGCGGGGSTPAADASAGGSTTVASGPALPKDEFIRRGDAVCTATRKEAQQLGRDAAALGGIELGDTRVYGQAAQIWRRQAQVIGKLDKGFEALGPAPDGIERQIGDFRDDIDKALGLAQEIANALEHNEDPTSLVGEYAQLIDDSNATIALAGFKVCGADAN